ncbi:MAG TPA: GNAT family N-acetyltransferase [Solirubrobacteraceae bacterium]|jgi:ribosomal protein S18 acetylase RimI-like enzyme|nr:GNAT family N-acetyltransferase [Solirubrobacteraceae bacterium]
MAQIRPYRPGDESALASVCLRTAAAGGDATGVLADDELWACLFVLPYLEHDPGLAFVVESDAGEPAGYVVATADSHAFEAWFRDDWWPRFAERWPEPERQLTEQDRLLRFAYDRSGEPGAFAAEFPAHLHIDLLPELQGQGYGRRLIDALKDALRDQGVAALHVVPLADNRGAIRFYERLGFSELGREARIVVLGLEL